MPGSLGRRTLLARSSAAGFFMVAGQWAYLTPREAQARQFDPQILTPDQTDALSTVGEVLVPGARSAGFAAYIEVLVKDAAQVHGVKESKEHHRADSRRQERDPDDDRDRLPVPAPLASAAIFLLDHFATYSAPELSPSDRLLT